MADRHVYLRIERVPDYSPVAPMDISPPGLIYKRDAMRNVGHADGTIPQAEVDARAMTAVVFREYLDADYLIPHTDKLIEADINEPVWDRRVPGCIVYAYPGQRLHIHVHNADTEVHSFHLHGLDYGIESDGAWPFGTEASDGRRSDEICSGQQWIYTFDVTVENMGVWPFHDHSRSTEWSVNRGLFGAVVVMSKKRCPHVHSHGRAVFDEYKKGLVKRLGRLVHRDALPAAERFIWAERIEFVHELLIRRMVKPDFVKGVICAPVFFHKMSSDESKPLFDSGDIEELGGTFSHTFAAAGDFDYFCSFHPSMTGTVQVISGGPATANVNIVDGPPMGFAPATIQVGPGGTVTWTNLSMQHHTVTSMDGANMPSHCLNGRAFVGNSPTILARAGQRIQWIVFNLDLGHEWHNFHPHASRWEFAGQNVDVRSLGPAESFIAETVAPQPVLLPQDIADTQDEHCRPKNAKAYWLKGDFVFHCHVHHHMMNGMIGTVRSVEKVWLTDAQKKQLEDAHGLQYFSPANTFPDVDADRCKKHGEGEWVELPNAPEVTFMHACLLPNTDLVLYWGYTRADQSRLHDTATDTVSTPANQPANELGGDIDLSDMWSAEHTFLDDGVGTLLVHGGFSPNQTFRFDPTTNTWTLTDATAHARFYSTTLTLADGKALTLYGSASKSIEVYDPASGTWGAPITLPAGMNHHKYYPWTFLLPDGNLAICGPHNPTHVIDWPTATIIHTKSTLHLNRSTGGEKGSAVLLPLRPPNYDPIVMIMGGNTAPTQQTTETIDLAATTPTWTAGPDLVWPRATQFTATLLPDGRVLAAGGIGGELDGGPSEIYDPRDPGAGWVVGPRMAQRRGYHSAFLLLADGSVLGGGDPNSSVSERYFPGYMSQPRPQITGAPASAAYGATITVDSPDAPIIAEAVLMRPGAVTHGFNMSQRLIECVIAGGTATSLDVVTPPTALIAPPGWHLLFLIDANRVPSEGRWIRLTP